MYSQSVEAVWMLQIKNKEINCKMVRWPHSWYPSSYFQHKDTLERNAFHQECYNQLWHSSLYKVLPTTFCHIVGLIVKRQDKTRSKPKAISNLVMLKYDRRICLHCQSRKVVCNGIKRQIIRMHYIKQKSDLRIVSRFRGATRKWVSFLNGSISLR